MSTRYNIHNYRLGFSPLSQQIFIYRHGKDSRVALDKRKVTADALKAVIDYMMADAPKGASQRVTFGEGWFEISVRPCRKPREESVELSEKVL